MSDGILSGVISGSGSLLTTITPGCSSRRARLGPFERDPTASLAAIAAVAERGKPQRPVFVRQADWNEPIATPAAGWPRFRGGCLR